MRRAAFILSLLILSLGDVWAGFYVPQNQRTIFMAATVAEGGGGPCPGELVTIPTAAIAVWMLDENTGVVSADCVVSTRVGGFGGDSTAMTWNSTGGARGGASISDRPTTGYFAISNDDTWMSNHAGVTTGEQTLMACIEPRQLAIRDRTFWGKYGIDGTSYEYLMTWVNASNTVRMVYNTTVGGTVSAFNSSATVMNQGARNSVVTRFDRKQATGSWIKMFVNGNLMSGSSVTDTGTSAATGSEMRFGTNGAGAGCYDCADANMSFYVLLYANPTAADIAAFRDDCAALTP